jgi:hypothetical protein
VDKETPSGAGPYKSFTIITIEKLLKSYYVTELKRYPVTRLVNRVENNSKGCIEPIKEDTDQEYGREPSSIVG